MDRDLEIRIKGHLYEIRELNDEVLESRQGFPMSEEGYEKTLRSVAEDAGAKQVDEVAEWIKDWIQSKEKRPPNRNVRREARKIISKGEFVIGEYLNAA